MLFRSVGEAGDGGDADHASAADADGEGPCLLYTSSGRSDLFLSSRWTSKWFERSFRCVSSAVSYTHLDVYKRQVLAGHIGCFVLAAGGEAQQHNCREQQRKQIFHILEIVLLECKMCIRDSKCSGKAVFRILATCRWVLFAQ